MGKLDKIADFSGRLGQTFAGMVKILLLSRRPTVVRDAQPGDELGLSFCNKAIGLLDRQLIKASYRLAKVLNELFDKP